MPVSLRTRVLLCAVVLLTAGCSFSFVYRQLDWLVPWYVSDYVSLDETQQRELEQRVLKQLAWHCDSQLPGYADWLAHLRTTPQALEREQLEHHYLTARSFWHKLMARVSADAAPLLLNIRPAQLQELMRNLEQRNRELAEEYADLSPDERLLQREERMAEILERWLGSLESHQDRAIAAWSVALGESDVEGWLERRRRWQERLRRVIEEAAEPATLQQALYTLLAEPESLWSERERREYARRHKLTLDLLATVAAGITPSQREHLDAQLLKWQQKFEALACVDEQAAIRP